MGCPGRTRRAKSTPARSVGEVQAEWPSCHGGSTLHLGEATGKGRGEAQNAVGIEGRTRSSPGTLPQPPHLSSESKGGWGQPKGRRTGGRRGPGKTWALWGHGGIGTNTLNPEMGSETGPRAGTGWGCRTILLESRV